MGNLIYIGLFHFHSIPQVPSNSIQFHRFHSFSSIQFHRLNGAAKIWMGLQHVALQTHTVLGYHLKHALADCQEEITAQMNVLNHHVVLHYVCSCAKLCRMKLNSMAASQSHRHHQGQQQQQQQQHHQTHREGFFALLGRTSW